MEGFLRAVLACTWFCGAVAAIYPMSAAHAAGVGYLRDADMLVYGGIYYWRVSGDNEDTHILYAQKPGSGVRSILRRFEGSLPDIKAAPHGGLVAVLEVRQEENVPPERANVISQNFDRSSLTLFNTYSRVESTLVIVDLEGRTYATIESVYAFEWDPGGKRIAYVTGKYSERDMGFDPEVTWIYDLATRLSTKVHGGSTSLHWAKWDGNLYFEDAYSTAGVMRFELDTGRVSTTTHRDIHFSPDGRYYFEGGSEGELGGRLFSAVDDKVVPLLPIRTLVGDDRPTIIGWLGSNIAIARAPREVEQVDYLYDLADATRRVVPGQVVALKDGDRIVIQQGKTFTESRISSLPAN